MSKILKILAIVTIIVITIDVTLSLREYKETKKSPVKMY